MSSMRNAVQRRPYRERSQPHHRRRLGLLEKHKDYSLRAADHKKKQATLKSLRQKAADRNEDEFYFGMLSRAGPSTRVSRGKGWTGTVDGDRGNTALSMESVRLLKTQDQGYLRTVRNVAAKEVRQLEESVVLAGGRVTGRPGRGEDDDEGEEPAERPRKIVFLDGEGERERAMPGLAHDGDSDGEEAAGESGEDGAEADEKAPTLERLQRRLRNARARLKTLTDAENELEIQRARMAKTATVGGVTKKGKKFKIRERKR